jgi:hypothetical protein
MGRIDDKTTIPLGIAILAIGGAAMWVSSQVSTIGYTASRVDAIEAERREERREYSENVKEFRKELQEFQRELERIKGYLQRERSRGR